MESNEQINNSEYNLFINHLFINHLFFEGNSPFIETNVYLTLKQMSI